MATRSPRRSPKRPVQRKQTSSGWLWLALGLGLGLIIAAGIYLFGVYGQVEPAAPVTQASHKAAEAQTTAASAPKQPKFEFYRMLPDLEVDVPEGAYQSTPKAKSEPEPESASEDQQNKHSAADAASTESRPAEIKPSGKSHFLLQAGAFKQAKQADQLKARLALLGLEANVQAVKVGDTTWHRVRLGPFADQDRAEHVRTRLGQKQIKAIVVRDPS